MKGATGKEKKKVKFSAEVSKERQHSTNRCFGALQTAASLGSGNLVLFSSVSFGSGYEINKVLKVEKSFCGLAIIERKKLFKLADFSAKWQLAY
jgi:hypothetical protein